MDGKKDIKKEQMTEEPPRIETINWGDLTWVNIESPTEREIEYLAQTFNFHRLALDDCLSRKQLPKLDVYPGYLFFIFQFPVYDKKTRISSKRQWSAFIGENYLVTLHPPELKTMSALFLDCQANEESRKEYSANGSGFLLYHILDRAIDAYFPVLDKILSLMEDIEDVVFDEEVETAKEISILRRDVITQRAVMFPTRAIFAQMQNKLKRFSKTDMTDLYGDLMDHTNKICETLDECKEIIEVFKDTDFILATDRINRVVRILNILATIFLPFVIISSIYGMNVILPGGLERGSLKSFLILLAVMSIITGSLLLFFRRRRWI
jgi:magnesium transporter